MDRWPRAARVSTRRRQACHRRRRGDLAARALPRLSGGEVARRHRRCHECARLAYQEVRHEDWQAHRRPPVGQGQRPPPAHKSRLHRQSRLPGPDLRRRARGHHRREDVRQRAADPQRPGARGQWRPALPPGLPPARALALPSVQLGHEPPLVYEPRPRVSLLRVHEGREQRAAGMLRPLGACGRHRGVRGQAHPLHRREARHAGARDRDAAAATQPARTRDRAGAGAAHRRAPAMPRGRQARAPGYRRGQRAPEQHGGRAPSRAR